MKLNFGSQKTMKRVQCLVVEGSAWDQELPGLTLSGGIVLCPWVST